MAGSLNKCAFIGNLGADPEMRQTKTGTQVCEVRLACNDSWKDKGGNKQERTEWVRIVCWDKLADIVCKYLKKGNKAYFEGRMQTREWDDKEGKKRWTTEIVAKEMIMLGGKGESSGSGSGSSSSAPSGNDDDIPF